MNKIKRTIEEVKPNFFAMRTEVIRKKDGKVLNTKFRQVYPIKKDLSKPLEKGNINWKNFLRIDWTTLLIIALIVFSLWAYQHDLKECSKLMSSPCIQECVGGCSQFNVDLNNLSSLNLSKEVTNEKKLFGKTVYNQGL